MSESTKIPEASFSRRSLLRGLSAGAVSPLLVPFLERLRAEDSGDSDKLPLRFLFVVKSSGLTSAELVPKSLAPRFVKKSEERGHPDDLTSSRELVDFRWTESELPKTLRALGPLVDKLSVVQGLSGRMCRGGHSAWYGALGCFHTGNEGNPGRPAYATIDGQLSHKLGGIFPHVGLSLGGKVLSGVKDSVVYPGISASAPDRPLSFQASPILAYKNLFGTVAAGKEARADQGLQSMLLDFMSRDIRRVKNEIGSADSEKLDQYLEAFEGLRDRRRKLSGLEAKLRKNAPDVNDKFSSDVETDRLEAHFDLAAATLISGISSVVTIRADTLDVTYRGLGISKHVHGLGHAESVHDMTPVEARRRIREFHLGQIVRVASKLAKTREGNGSMLDRTLIVYMSDAAERHHASCFDWPFVLLGGLGDRWRAGGRYLQFPGYESAGHHTIATLYSTLMHAVGQPKDQFGRLDVSLDAAKQTGPLSELLS